jgi:hypothetical protein
MEIGKRCGNIRAPDAVEGLFWTVPKWGGAGLLGIGAAAYPYASNGKEKLALVVFILE